MKNILYLTFLIITLMSYDVSAQCDVVDSRGVALVTTNGLHVVRANAGNCNQDSDADGILDAEDACDMVAGVASNYGCPADADKDGVYDTDDKCPNLSGISANNGCPADSDNDGVYDVDDKCPETAGVSANKGCPSDSDGDGIYDADDKCPELAGISSNGGCPADTDGDGVYDNKDSCPNEAGVAKNNGCPELNEEEKEVLKEALEGVNFLSGKDVLTNVSKPKLDNVAEILKAHQSYNLKVSGYTDSSGDENANLALSKKRAEAVKQYLISDGIDEARIESDGFGEASPIADNGTREGRAKNRRVEFEIIF